MRGLLRWFSWVGIGSGRAVDVDGLGMCGVGGEGNACLCCLVGRVPEGWGLGRRLR